MYAVIRPVCVTFTLVAVAVVIAADFSRTAVLGAPTGTGTRTDTNDGLLKIIEALSLRVLTLEGRQEGILPPPPPPPPPPLLPPPPPSPPPPTRHGENEFKHIAHFSGRTAGGRRALVSIGKLTEPKLSTKEVCGGYDDSSFHGNARYLWCNKAMDFLRREKGSTPKLGIVPIAVSFGINSIDYWSQSLSHLGFQTHLYDCFHFSIKEDSKGYNQQLPFVKHTDCWGKEDYEESSNLMFEGVETTAVRKFKSTDTLWSELGMWNRPRFSVMLKLDIEGSEWKIFEKLQPRHFERLMSVDVEVHWCISRDGQDWSRERAVSILKSMALLNKYFLVTGRSVEPLKQDEVPNGGWDNAGCHEEQWTMMALSYVNKAYAESYLVNVAPPSGRDTRAGASTGGGGGAIWS